GHQSRIALAMGSGDLGWCAARMDDIFSFIPARICGLLLFIMYAMKGRIKPAYAIFIRDRLE
ncbi:cobalamin biosynthesis protein, partial [Klebsiella aerogenes]|uniref:cobalamin biosynthesis protein n=1 Tax=Klebsiella aerogenes TaxID=548 RepID=UPI0019530FDB